MKNIDITLQSRHHDRPFMADATFLPNGEAKPVIIFNHGFKGFKDWGPFHLVARYFAQAGFVFIKMNFSHNGVTIDHPSEFADLEAFASNNFCIEQDDTGVLIDALFHGHTDISPTEMDLQHLYITGHSRGGAAAILKAAEEPRIKALATWAAVNNLETWHSKKELEAWKHAGRIFIHNSRTNQDMPMDYQLVENYLANSTRLDVPKAIKNMSKPMICFHGSDDPTVPVQAVHEIKSWNPSAEVHVVEGAGHTFGGTHPYLDTQLTPALEKVVSLTASFFNQIR